MARTISSSEARRLAEDHKKLLSELIKADQTAQKYIGEILNAFQKAAGEEAFTLLKEIPVDELNRDKRGIRIKALKDSGYLTIADIVPVSPYSLESIQGISHESARLIKQIAEQIASEASKGVKLKLSADKKTAACTRLVNALTVYQLRKINLDICRECLETYREPVEKALSEMKPLSSGIRWLLTSSTKKERAEAAASALSRWMESYGVQAKEALFALDKIRFARMTDEEAWRRFTADPIPVINLLEELDPRFLGTDDAVYGLPEELAAEIQEEELFPDGLLCTLRRYQEWGVKYILHQGRVLLGDEMGLGKTIQAIAAMVSLKNTGASHFLVVCPASVLTNWCREISKMSRLSVIKVHGSSREAALEEWKRVGGVAVTTYETTGLFSFEKGFPLSMLVVDEAHYIKNPEAQRTQNVKRICRAAERLLFMTGTALENRVDEMVNLIRVLQPEIAEKVKGIEALASAPRFRELVAPVYYRRKREDVLTELPELIENQEWCTLGAEEEAAYEKAVLSRNYPAARRVSWNVDDLSKSSKANRLKEIAEEAESDDRKMIVFSFFLDTIDKVSRLLGDKCMPIINGSVPPQRRQEIIDQFDQAPAGSVLAAQIQSGGTGLNIQSASIVVICEPQFKPSIENQAISRAYRMGQTRNVLVYRLLCDDTVDERITQLLEKKQGIFDAFADESAAADESRELDQETFGNIIQEEIDRINAKAEARVGS